MQIQQEQEQSVSSQPFVTPISQGEQRPREEFAPITKAVRRKRISRKRYVVKAAQVVCLKIGSFGLTGLAALLGAGIGALLCLMIGMELWIRLAHPVISRDFQSGDPWWMFALNVGAMLLPFAFAACISYWMGRGMRKQAVHMETVLLTHTNTADLPVKESLVRASQEPVQEQKVVLLRAVAQTQFQHEEQLLRAAEGTE